MEYEYDEDDVPEVEEDEQEEEGVAESYARLNALLRSYDFETVQWSNELNEELTDLTKQNLINRVNVHDLDAEIFQVLGSIDHTRDRSEEFNFRDELLNPNKLENDLITLMSTVDTAKSTSAARMQKLKSGFATVKNVQKMVVEKTVKRFRIESGVTKVESRIEELNEQVADLQKALQEKKEIIHRNNREKTLSAEELRKKYEAEMEERIRSLMVSVEQKNKVLTTVMAANEQLSSDTLATQNELGKLLQDLEREERAGAADTSANSTDPLHRARASMYRGGTSNTKGGAQFVDISSGTITKDLVGDSQKALQEAFARQQELYTQMADTEEKTVRMRRELTSLLQSEEHKALERLKKVCDNLQVKIQSDEQRVKVMAGLVQQMQKTEVQTAHRPRIRKTVMDLAKSQDKPAVDGNVRTRVRKHPSGAHDGAEEDVMPLVRDVGDKETISMKLHRRLYAQYFTAFRNDANIENGSADADGGGSPTRRAAQNKPAADLPRKRRITLAQSAKIQKIIDMFNMQHTKLTSVGADDIQHILDYREFEEEAERPESTLSYMSETPAVTPAGSSRQYTTSAPSTRADSGGLGDTTRMFPQRAEPVASVLETHAKQNAADIPTAVQSAKEAARQLARSGAGNQAVIAPAQDPYAHLRIPTTAALEDQNEADFYTQNYGMKLALEHLNAFMEILTNGRSSDTTFLNDSGGKKNVGLATSEPQELQTVEGLRASIQKLVEMIREMHFMSKNSKGMRKDLQNEVDAKLKACDRLRNDLLHEIEGSHWPTSMKAGQYELEIEICEQNMRELKKSAKNWDQQIGLKRAQNIRLSQAITTASARRAVTMFKSATEEYQRRHQAKVEAAAKPAPTLAPKATAPAAAPATEAKPGDPALAPAPEPESELPSTPLELPSTPLELANRQIADRYSVANKRMTLFDDIASIYDTTMANLKKMDRTSAGGGTRPSAEATTNDANQVLSPADVTVAADEAAATEAPGEGTKPSAVTYDGCEEDQNSDGWEELQT